MRPMIEGAIITSIFIALLLVAVYTPIGMLAFIVLPIPFIVYTSRHSVRQSILAGVVSLLVSIPFGMILSFPLVLYGWGIGTILGYSFGKRHSPIQTLMVSFISLLSFILLVLAIATMIFDYNLIEEVMQITKEMFEESDRMFGDALGGPIPDDLKEQLFQQLNTLFPSMIILYSFFVGAMIYWIGYGVLKRLGTQPVPFPGLAEISFPRSLLFYYLGVLVFAFIPDLSETEWVYAGIANLLSIFEMVIGIQGVLFVFHFARMKGMGRGLPILSAVLLFIPPFDYILRLIGILDLGINLRKKWSSGS